MTIQELNDLQQAKDRISYIDRCIQYLESNKKITIAFIVPDSGRNGERRIYINDEGIIEAMKDREIARMKLEKQILDHKMGSYSKSEE